MVDDDDDDEDDVGDGDNFIAMVAIMMTLVVIWWWRDYADGTNDDGDSDGNGDNNLLFFIKVNQQPGLYTGMMLLSQNYDTLAMGCLLVPPNASYLLKM